MIELEEISVLQPSGIADGRTVWQPVAARGRLIEFSQRDVEYFGAVKGGMIVLISGAIPARGARIAVGGMEYDVKSVRVCRNLAGRLIGCRAVVV